MKKTTKLYYDSEGKTKHHDALGIEEGRADEIAMAAMIAVLNYHMSDSEKNTGDMVQKANKEAAPQNIQEAFWLGWSIANAQATVQEKFSNPILSILKNLDK